MSIALDLALLLRNSSTKFGLSLSNIGVLYTLAFRVGTKSNTWINQQTLAKELGITIRALRKHHKSLEDSNILQIKTNTKDKRKYLYSFNSSFLNYHQMKKEDRLIIHQKLGDTYDERDIKVNHDDKNRGTKVPLSSENRGTKVPLNRGTKVPLFSDFNFLEAVDTQGLAGNDISPKGTIENNIKSKGTYISCTTDVVRPGFDKFWLLYPRKENRAGALKIWNKKKLEDKAHEIEAHLMKRLEGDWKNKDKQYIPMPTTFLNGERWTDDLTASQQVARPKNAENNLMMMIYKHTMGA